MYVSLIDVIGPVMIGPSSSHTAGAAKLARAARAIVEKTYNHVIFSLGGSFASTYKGHFTDYALVAGALGMREDDENISESFRIAKERNLSFSFQTDDISSEYDNSVRFSYTLEDGSEYCIEGASLGGGRILITNINGLPCEIGAELPTVIVRQRDVKGVVRDISAVLTAENINIASMRVNRTGRGDLAFCTIECDQKIPPSTLKTLERTENILSVVLVDIHGE